MPVGITQPKGSECSLAKSKHFAGACAHMLKHHRVTRNIEYTPVRTSVWALPHATRVTKRAVSGLTRRGLGKLSGEESEPGGVPWPHWPSMLLPQMKSSPESE